MEYDKYGIAIGNYVYMRGPVMDETHPSLVSAMRAAGEALLDGAERVRVYSVRYSERRQDYLATGKGPLVDACADVAAIEAINEAEGAG